MGITCSLTAVKHNLRTLLKHRVLLGCLHKNTPRLIMCLCMNNPNALVVEGGQRVACAPGSTDRGAAFGEETQTYGILKGSICLITYRPKQ